MSIRKRRTTEMFISDAIAVHGDSYDYNLTNYTNTQTDVNIICKIHGIFSQNPNSHLRGSGCKECGYIRNSKTFKYSQEEFISKCSKIHENKYDYTPTKYIDILTPIEIVCPVHGVFTQSPRDHIRGHGCKLCRDVLVAFKRAKTTDQFILDAKNVHGDKYEYKFVNYVNSKIKVKIICKEHGEFPQSPYNHLNGDGCPHCVTTSKGELKIKQLLDSREIEYVKEYRFEDCRDKYPLPFDFYIPQFNLCIEYDGKHHFKSIPYFGGDEHLKIVQHRDKIKTNYCRDNNIKLIRIPYTEFNNIESILENEMGSN